MQVLRLVSSAALVGVVTLTSASAAFAHSTDPLEAAPTAAAPNAKLEAASGTVRQLIIEDHVAGMTVRHVAIVPATGAAMALVGKEVDQLTAGQSVSVTGRRNGRTLFVETLQTGKSAAAPVQEREHVEGKLAVAHADNFETGISEYLYEVRGDDGSVTNLSLAVQPETLQAGMRVRAHGDRPSSTEQLEPARIEILALPAATSDAEHSATAAAVTAKATTMHKVLVVALKFKDTATDPMPISSVQGVMVSAADSVANFYKEASYGQHQLTVTVPSAWLRTTIATPTSCNYSAISTAGDAAATAAGYNLASYEFKVYVFPKVSTCVWWGLGYVGFPRMAYINGTTAIQTKVIGHEMGHNFGLLHAASLDCGARSVGGSCTASEYGDPFNTMGNSASMHFAAAQKSLLGWIPSTSVKTHTTGSATYVLNPIESAGGSVYAVKIPAAAKRTYWLEYRQPIGFDAGLSAYPTNGAQIRLASPFDTLCSGCGGGSDDTELLDLTTATTPFTDAALTVGKSFTDPDYGFTVNVISATPTALTVQVSASGSNPPSPKPTTTTVKSSANPSSWGASVTFTATINGASPTGSVAYMDGASTVAGCSAVALTGSGNARTAACTTGALAAGSHNITAKYSGDASNASSTSSALTQSVNATSSGSNTNVALASAGASATASSMLSSSYAPSLLINGDAKGVRVGGAPGWWTDATPSVFPDWVQITLKSSKTVDHVVLYSMQDNYDSPLTPTSTMTFKTYGVRDFTVQGWNGSGWVTLGTVTGNTLVQRTVSFTPMATDRIRINITKSANAYSRLTEVEVWGK